ncbi:hypothetical protein B9Z19DRAFT_1134544 [Tuber borchii]|uniref:Uncharacterized protein n=1 Tax=Tuber borchii TaxID=42251 RepID=A0A2T6ZE28_TUBBO|nr:hypothetical protein B9Z19DRAFT_1134544 [Tuber borchii]
MKASGPSKPADQSAGGDLFKGFSSLSNRLTDCLKDAGVLGGALENMISGVKASSTLVLAESEN